MIYKSASRWASLMMLVLHVIDPSPCCSLSWSNWIVFNFQLGAQQLRYITYLNDSSFESAFFNFAASSWRWGYELICEAEEAVADFRATTAMANKLGIVSRFLKLRARFFCEDSETPMALPRPAPLWNWTRLSFFKTNSTEIALELRVYWSVWSIYSVCVGYLRSQQA